jgi:hypothetical protein
MIAKYYLGTLGEDLDRDFGDDLERVLGEDLVEDLDVSIFLF